MLVKGDPGRTYLLLTVQTRILILIVAILSVHSILDDFVHKLNRAGGVVHYVRFPVFGRLSEPAKGRL